MAKLSEAQRLAVEQVEKKIKKNPGLSVFQILKKYNIPRTTYYTGAKLMKKESTKKKLLPLVSYQKLIVPCKTLSKDNLRIDEYIVLAAKFFVTLVREFRNENSN